jgi:hypothetical protein
MCGVKTRCTSVTTKGCRFLIVVRIVRHLHVLCRQRGEVLIAKKRGMFAAIAQTV